MKEGLRTCTDCESENMCLVETNGGSGRPNSVRLKCKRCGNDMGYVDDNRLMYDHTEKPTEWAQPKDL